MIRRFSVVALLLALAIVPAASAQQRGRGGFGGFGGMQASSGALLRIPEVRQELKLNDDQQKQVEEVLGERRGGQGGFNRGDFQNLSEEERQKRFAEMREQFEKANKETDEKVAKILDESQQKRLGELRLQREGINALRRKDVAEKLGLTDDQQQKIRQIQEENRPNANFRNLSDDERREAFTKMREQREKAEKDTLAVLTAEQQSKWNDMKRKEFDFPQQRGGRRPNN
jgi:Spy/CpxP family protein refolding chaperone